MDAELRALLSRLALDRLGPTLAENDILSLADLRLLTERDYVEMRISIGVRRRLLDACAAQPRQQEQLRTPPPACTPEAMPGSAFGFIAGGAVGGGPRGLAEAPSQPSSERLGAQQGSPFAFIGAGSSASGATDDAPRAAAPLDAGMFGGTVTTLD